MVLRSVLTGRTLTAVLVLVLLGLNVLVIAERRSVRTSGASSLSNAPRIGAVLEQRRFESEKGLPLHLPSPDHASTVIYLSGSDPVSLGELAVLDVIGRTDLNQHARIVWLNLGYDSFEPVIDHNGLSFDVVDGSRRALKRLGLTDPIQGTVIVTSGKKIAYEGRVQKAHLAHQIAVAAGLDFDLTGLLPGADRPFQGVLRGRSGIADLEKTVQPTVLLLYAGYCGMCGENELYQALRESTDLTVYAVFPDLERDSGVRELISTLNMDMDFHFLPLATSTLDLDAFLYADPGVLFIEDAKVRYAARSTDSIREIVHEISVLTENSRTSQVEGGSSGSIRQQQEEEEW